MLKNFKGVPVLITGVFGFIGSHLARRLILDGAEVHGLDKENIDLDCLQDIKDKVHFHLADLTDFDATKNVISAIKPQKIFHLAAYVDVSRSLGVMDEMIEINIRGTSNVLRALEDIKYDCFINTGTCEEYGDNPVPFTEDQIPNPVSPYSASKVATTMFCRMLYKTRNLPIVTLRPFLTYGPGQDNNLLIPSLIRGLLKGEEYPMTAGEQTREFNYVDDIVNGYLKAAVTPEAIGQIINVGNGIEYQIRDVAEMVVRLMDSSVKPNLGALAYRPGETWHFYCNNQKARNILGWESKTNLEAGLKMTIDWFRKRYSPENK